jgi:YVTN family beta-propeller protein
MLTRAHSSLLSASLLLLSSHSALTQQPVAQSSIQATLPNGREIRPEGKWITVAPFPFALAVRPDGNQLAVPSIGWPFSLNLIDAPTGDAPTMHRYPEGHQNDPAIETHAGVAYSLDGSMLYLASGDSGKVKAYSAKNFKFLTEASLNGIIPTADGKPGQKFDDSFAATLILSPDGRTLYALDQGNWRVVIMDALTLQLISSVPTGSYPFGLALSPDGTRLYVTNTGLFEYKLVSGIKKEDLLGTGMKFAPFAYPSKEAREGTTVDGYTVPGLGDENSTRGSSLWSYDVHDPHAPAITAKLRLGERITEKIGATLGGAAPTGVVATADKVYVSLAHEDAVDEISADGAKLLRQLELTPFTGARFTDAQGHPLRGVMPSGLALNAGHLYVAESGIDAVADVDLASFKANAQIPVGWNPSAVALSPDGATLYVVNTKGKGAGPNGGNAHKAGEPTYIGTLELGSVSVIRLSSLAAPEELTRRVIENNEAALLKADPLPRLKHCFFVIRENRTYDEILGDITGANGDPTLARYGLDGWAEESNSATHLKVTPNLHALAAQFAIGDNYFVDSDVSVDGHRWALGVNPTPFFNTAWTSGYGGRRHGFAGAEQPGRRAMFGGGDAPMPEDEPQFGSLWEHIVAGGKGVLNYGEGLEIEGTDEMDGSEPEGHRMFLNAPLPKPVFEGTDRHYPTFNLGIPDQYRFAEFERDFKRRLAAGKIPEFVVIRLPNDHTSKPRDEDGYPYRASFVADNDLALGKIIDLLSKTSIWKDSALFVTEDDSQGGVDHIDAHRSVLLIASPWVKPGSVSRNHTSMGSITRTISELLGLGPLNLEDALAGEINGVFDSTPHLAPFNFLASDTRVFDPAKAKLAHPKTKQEAAELKDVDNADEIRKEVEKSGKKLKKPVDND